MPESLADKNKKKIDARTKKIVIKGFMTEKELREFEKEEEIRDSLHYSNIDGIFSSISSSILASFLIPYALFLKATTEQIGIMTAAQSLAQTVSQIPGAKATEYYSRKSIWLFSRVMARVVFLLPLVLLSFIEVSNPVFWMIVLSSAIYFFMGLSTPAWSSLIGDLVPSNIRGRYFGNRNVLITVAGIAGTLAGGYILTMYGFPTIFIMFGLFGLMAIPFFMKMYEPAHAKSFHYRHRFAINPSHWPAAIRANKGLAIFTVYMVGMNFAVMIAAPFYAVYMLKDLGVSYTMFAVLTTLGAVARVVSFKYWGRLNDNFGSRKTFIVTAILGCFIPFMWLWVGDALTAALVIIFDGLIWSGFELVAFDYLLDITPADRRPQYIANHNFFVGFGIVAGSIAGGLLSTVFEHQAFLIFAGIQLVFMASFVARLVFLTVLPKITEIEISHSSIVPVRYVFWKAVAVEPVRGIQHSLAYTFKFPYEIGETFKDELTRIKYKYKMARN